jgi:hypothetical protein
VVKDKKYPQGCVYGKIRSDCQLVRLYIQSPTRPAAEMNRLVQL